MLVVFLKKILLHRFLRIFFENNFLKNLKRKKRERFSRSCGATARRDGRGAETPIETRQRRNRRGFRLTAVVAVIQRAETIAATATTERKRKAALVLGSAPASVVRRQQSAVPAAAVAMAAGRRGHGSERSRVSAQVRQSRAEVRGMQYYASPASGRSRELARL